MAIPRNRIVKEQSQLEKQADTTVLDIPTPKATGNPPRVWYFTPWRADLDLGKAYNECFEMVKSDDDWVCLMDRDIILLDHTYGKIIQWCVENYPDTGIFTCTTNRLSIKPQLHPDGKLFKETNILVHARQAKADARTKKYKVTHIYQPIAGLFMVIKKSVWKELKFAEGGKALNVDIAYSSKMLQLGYQIRRMEGVYVYHYYRHLEGKEYKQHLM